MVTPLANETTQDTRALLASARPATRATPCPVAPDGRCEFGAPEPFFDRSGLVGAVGVARCRHCGIGLSCPPLADVAFLYAARSSQDFQQSGSKLTYTVKRIAFGRQARALMRQIGGAPRRIIDFGCGSGLFTRRLAEIQSGADVIGSDFHSQPPADLDSVSYRAFDRLDELAGSADLVLAMHVLEHDDDSMALLGRIVRLGKPGARVVLEVPNVDCLWAPVFGRFWDAWYLPYHRVHFTRASLRGLLESAGLTVELEAPACVPTMGRTVANLLGRKNSPFFIVLGIVLHPIQWLGERFSRRPSALRAVARIPS
jgi:SAM-dependent methyltransferase